MSSRTLFLLSALVTGIFALAALLIPVKLVTLYGVEFSNNLGMMTRYFGTAMLVIAFVSYYLRGSDITNEVKSVVLALIISDIVGVIVSLWYTLNNTLNSLGWLNVIIYAFFVFAFYSVYKKK